MACVKMARSSRRNPSQPAGDRYAHAGVERHSGYYRAQAIRSAARTSCHYQRLRRRHDPRNPGWNHSQLEARGGEALRLQRERDRTTTNLTSGPTGVSRRDSEYYGKARQDETIKRNETAGLMQGRPTHQGLGHDFSSQERWRDGCWRILDRPRYYGAKASRGGATRK